MSVIVRIMDNIRKCSLRVWTIFVSDGSNNLVVYDKNINPHTVYPKKYAHGFCFAVLCCGYTLTDFPISIRLTSLALWQSNDCPSASKSTLMNMDKYFMWIHYERLHNHNKAKHNKTVCIFLGIYCNTKDVYLLKCMRCVYPSFKHCVTDDDYITSEVILGIYGNKYCKKTQQIQKTQPYA